MSVKRISKDVEARLADCVEKVATQVSEGGDLDDIITKVAEDASLTPGHIRLVCQAYNNGRTNVQRKHASDLFDKSASFRLADAEKVIRNLYPEHIKTAAEVSRETTVSDVYNRPPSLSFRSHGMTKEASCPPLVARSPDPYPRERDHSKKAMALLQAANCEVLQKRAALAHMRDCLTSAFEDLRTYFHGVGMTTIKQASVNAGLMWGPSASVVFKHLTESDPFLKKAMAGALPGHSGMDASREPYSLVVGCIKLAREYKAAQAEFEAFSKEATRLGKEINDRLVPDRPYHQGSILRPMQKEALLLGGVLGESLGKSMGNTGAEVIGRAMPKPLDKLKEEAFLDVTSPAHESKLRNIRSQAVLHDILANDEFLSAEHPERVAKTYNEIARLSPRAAEQPMLMRALLRRYLAQGSADPHDIDQMVGIESKLKDQEAPRREFNMSPLFSTTSSPSGPRLKE